MGISNVEGCFFFNVYEKSIRRSGTLVKAHVFINQPIVSDKYVYALGHEYYINNKNVHRFSLDERKWDIIF